MARLPMKLSRMLVVATTAATLMFGQSPAIAAEGDDPWTVIGIEYDQAWFVLLRHPPPPWERPEVEPPPPTEPEAPAGADATVEPPDAHGDAPGDAETDTERDAEPPASGPDAEEPAPRWRIFDGAGRPIAARIHSASLLDLETADAVARIVSDPKSYDGWSEECLYNYCAFVFYREGRPVCEVVPNLTGGDMGCRPDPPFESSGSMSREAYEEIVRLAFGEVAHRDDDVVARMPPPDDSARKIQDRGYRRRRLYPGQGFLEVATPPNYSSMASAVQSARRAISSFRDLSDIRRRTALVRDMLRAFFGKDADIPLALFRILGCVPTTWDRWFEPEQTVARTYLEEAPREELERAFAAASRSEDLVVRKGAARAATWLRIERLFPRSEADVARWRALLAGEAYADPFPENRRLLLEAALGSKEPFPREVAARAATDPDPTVRRQAFRLLARDGSDEALEVLRKVAEGQLAPRAPEGPPPRDFGGGAIGSNRAAEEEECPGTDAEAAGALLDAR